LPAPAKRYFQQLPPARLIKTVFQQQAGAGDDEAQRIAEVVSDDAENLLACVRQQLRVVPFLTLGVLAQPYFFLEMLQFGSARFGHRSPSMQPLHRRTDRTRHDDERDDLQALNAVDLKRAARSEEIEVDEKQG